MFDRSAAPNIATIYVTLLPRDSQAFSRAIPCDKLRLETLLYMTDLKGCTCAVFLE
jgi:hypothetical protein